MVARFKRVGCALAAVAAAAFTSLHAMPAPPAEQQICPPHGSAPGQWAVLSVKKSDNVCPVSNGGYIKTSALYKLHIAAQVTGSCQTQKWEESSALPPVGACVDDHLYIRTIATSTLFINGVNSGSVALYPSNSATLQNYDTSVPTNTLNAGWLWTTNNTGMYTYSSNTAVNATQCMLEPTVFPQTVPFVMNAVACQPTWMVATNGLNARIAPQTPGTRIQVFLDPLIFPGAATQMDAAITAWNAALPSSVQLERVTSACGSGPTCIQVYPSALIGDKCGKADGTSSNITGDFLGNLEIKMHPNWAGWGPHGLQRTFAHELGHLLGLGNYMAACTISQAVMQDDYSCATASGTSLPTTNDTIPVVNSVYGGRSRDSCGW